MNLIKYLALGLGILVLLWLMAMFPSLSLARQQPPVVRAMYACNHAPAAWTEREMRCVVRVRFGSSGQYDNAVRIVNCETGDTWNRFAVSRTNDHGLFQINRTYNSDPWTHPLWWGHSIYDPVVNTQWAYHYWQTRGWGDWTCAHLMGVS